ncbi:MAG: FKBP-type peptidyl-prolyl cis-trans isomerase [Bacteroidales bacterium]|nr:FKBP-type peptidyl-prolyl cis-trans isomerase [Bacteroidales bacterium]
MSRLLIVVLSLIFVATACDSPFPDFEDSPKGFYYQFYKLGEDTLTAQYNDYVTVNIAYSTVEDSLFFSAKRQFQIQKADYNGAIDECFRMMSEGDSAVFLISADVFFTKTLEVERPSFLKATDFFKVSVEMLGFISESQFEKEKKEFLAWIDDFSQYEKTKLNHYLESCNNDYSTNPQGFYKMIVDTGIGETVKFGDTLVLQYEGRFINGKFFDSTYKRNRPFEFIYGTEWQVIKGIELVVAGMKEGEKSIVILPSELAFGSGGNSNGVIPPFSTLIYEIELTQIRR